MSFTVPNAKEVRRRILAESTILRTFEKEGGTQVLDIICEQFAGRTFSEPDSFAFCMMGVINTYAVEIATDGRVPRALIDSLRVGLRDCIGLFVPEGEDRDKVSAKWQEYCDQWD